MDHETWSTHQSRAALSIDDHDVGIAYYDEWNAPNHRHMAQAEKPRDKPDKETRNGDGTVVFLHGIPTWSFLWRDIIDAVPKSQRAIAIDLAGYGHSQANDGFDRSIRAQEELLAGFLDVVGADFPVTLVGHDIGGGVALRFAAHRSDAVEQLVLSNAVCYDSWPVEFISNLGLPETTQLGREAFNGKLDVAFGDGLYGDRDDHEEFITGMKAPWLAEGGQMALARAAVATNTNHTTELEYTDIQADTLLLWGADDVLQPISYAERLASDITGDTTIIALEDAYHWVIEDRTRKYRKELNEFLSNRMP